MIRRNILQTILVLLMVIIFIILSLEQSHQKKTQQSIEKQLARISLIHSQVASQVNQYNWQQTNADQTLINQIDRIPGVIASQMINERQLRSLGRDILNENNAPYQVTHFIYLPKALRQSLKNVLVFKILLSPNPSDLLTTELIVVLIILMILFSLFLFRQFGWVEQLEDYAKHVLSNANNQVIDLQKPVSNVIGHAMSQLILNNSHMTKEKVELAEKVRKTSYIDKITGLGDHLFFKAELQVRLHNHGESESGLVAVLSFLNNDPVETTSLSNNQQIEIAILLKSLVSNIEHSLVARLKHSEFALLLPYMTANQIDLFCKKLILQFAKSIFDKPQQRDSFIDIGLSNYKQGFGYYNIMSEADMALRNAQLQGSNSWFFYGEPLPESKLKGGLRWRDFLQKILDLRSILLFSQRIHYFTANNCVHYEILSRIEDENQILSADRFLAMANQCGLAADFDRQIIDDVIKYILFHQNEPGKPIYSVNLFITSLLDNRFTYWLIGRLSSYPQLKQQLMFELPENQISKHVGKIAQMMNQLSALGIRWCVEHFGSPEENLSYLNKVSISMVKIDRRIINNISCNKEQQLLLSSMIVSLRSRNIKIFAEGVEKSLDADYLESTDIDGVQGYYFDKPRQLPPSQSALQTP